MVLVHQIENSSFYRHWLFKHEIMNLETDQWIKKTDYITDFAALVLEDNYKCTLFYIPAVILVHGIGIPNIYVMLIFIIHIIRQCAKISISSLALSHLDDLNQELL